jgi:hypothetical protein
MRRAAAQRTSRHMFSDLRCGLVERREELLDVLDLNQSALVLVVGPPCVGSSALGRLAVAQIQDVLLRGGTMSSESKHDDPPRSQRDRHAWIYLVTTQYRVPRPG